MNVSRMTYVAGVPAMYPQIPPPAFCLLLSTALFTFLQQNNRVNHVMESCTVNAADFHFSLSDSHATIYLFIQHMMSSGVGRMLLTHTI